MPSSDVQIRQAFVDLLHQYEPLRISWYMLLVGVGAAITIPEPDQVAFDAKMAALDAWRPGAVLNLFVFVLGLHHYAPDYHTRVDGLSLNVWLKRTVAAYRAGTLTDPLRPWHPGGRPQRFTNAQLRQKIPDALQRLARVGVHNPTEEQLLAEMGLEGMDPKRMREWAHRLGWLDYHEMRQHLRKK